MPAQASSNWLRINPSAHNSREMFVDLSSIEYKNTDVYYLARVDEAGKDSLVCLIKSDCKNNKNVLWECKDSDKNKIKPASDLKSSSYSIPSNEAGILSAFHCSMCNSYLKNQKINVSADGIHEIYDTDGYLLAKLTYIDGRLNGIATKYYQNGKVKQEAYFKDNKQEGPARTYYESGQLRKEDNFINDMQEGMSFTYYKNGKIRSKTPWKHGNEDGIAYFYHKNGAVEWVIPYKDAKEDGYVVQYYKNGKTRQLTPYENGVKNGYYTLYDKKGKIVKIKNYKNDTVIEQKDSVIGRPYEDKKSNIDWKTYIKDLEETVKSNWHPPVSGHSASAEILFEIEKNGSISVKQVVSSSGNKDFDNKAVSAIEKTAKYKPLPKNFTQDYILISFTFNYNLEILSEKYDYKIQDAISLLKNSVFEEPYKIISGMNPTEKAYFIEFKNFKKMGKKFNDYTAVGWKENGRQYIFISQKHKDAPPEALAALIAGRCINFDEFDSVNEEAISLMLEACIWKSLAKNSISENDTLTAREKEITKIISTVSDDGNELIDFIKQNKSYINLPQESAGYSNNEFKIKFSKLLEMYRNLD